ncbi:MAG: P-II family nitrogen regulator [Alphaproteobacteria bacterium]|jgi:nitrogen regulatory protein P-II 1|nr:P-II family nitrogen regulator [Alphaproteobacteria bacterium]MBN9590974.1 P-II family nitrogen regulator [Alphaproteobacteria bacterium]
MKRVEAIIQPHRLPKVVQALHTLPAFPGFTILDAHGQGRGRGAGGHFIHEPNEGLLYHRRTVIVVICENDRARDIAQKIVQTAHTGNPGDGIITISDVSEVIRIRGVGGRP